MQRIAILGNAGGGKTRLHLHSPQALAEFLLQVIDSRQSSVDARQKGDGGK